VLLEEVARLGLVAEPSPAAPGRLTWHPLVREALRARWEGERPAAERAALHRRAALRLVASGLNAEATERWLDAGEPEAAVASMVAVAPQVLRAAPATMHRWLDA